MGGRTEALGAVHPSVRQHDALPPALDASGTGRVYPEPGPRRLWLRLPRDRRRPLGRPQLVADQGYVENVAARLKTLAAGDNIALTTEGEVITISTSAALASDPSNLQAAIDTKQPALLSLPSLPGSGRYDIFDGIGFKSLSAAVPLSIANDGINLALSLDSSGFQPIFNPVFPLSLAPSNLQLAIGPYGRQGPRSRSGHRFARGDLQPVFYPTPSIGVDDGLSLIHI